MTELDCVPEESINKYLECSTNQGGVTWLEVLSDFLNEGEDCVRNALRQFSVSQLALVSNEISTVREEVKTNTLNRLRAEAARLGLSDQDIVSYFGGQAQEESNEGSDTPVIAKPTKKASRTINYVHGPRFLNPKTNKLRLTHEINYLILNQPDITAIQVHKKLKELNVIASDCLVKSQIKNLPAFIKKNPEYQAQLFKIKAELTSEKQNLDDEIAMAEADHQLKYLN